MRTPFRGLADSADHRHAGHARRCRSGGREAARRQGRGRGVLLRADRHRDAQAGSSRATASTLNRSCSRATPGCSKGWRQTRSTSRSARGRRWLHRQGFADQGHRGDGRPTAAAGASGAAGRSENSAELKGKKVGVSTVGSLTYWLVRETSRQQGWGPTGIQIAPLGAPTAQYAALERKDVDGIVIDISTAFEFEKNGKGRILMRFGDLVSDFIST